MKDRFDRVFFKHSLDLFYMTQIALFKIAPLNSFPVAINKIVKYDCLIPFHMQLFVNMGTDVAGSAAY